MSGEYAAGRRVEWAVVHHLTGEGYDCIRASSSKGPVGDVVAFKPGQVLVVNVKRTRPPGPDDRANLLRVAACDPCIVPLVALGPASRLTFRRLTGPGPDQWVPWVADVLAEVTSFAGWSVVESAIKAAGGHAAGCTVPDAPCSCWVVPFRVAYRRALETEAVPDDRD